MSTKAAAPVRRFDPRSLRRAAPLLALACLLVAVPLHAQLVIESTDEYAQLIFEAEDLDGDSLAAPAPNKVPERTAVDAAAARADGLRQAGELQRTIEAALAEQGLYSTALLDEYRQLALVQQRLGQHQAAVETLEKSVHIARVNDGLFTLDQEADIKEIIRSLVALGDTTREAEYRSYLYYLQQRAFAPDDPRFAQARLAWADWNLARYQLDSILHPRMMQLPGSNTPEELVVVRNSRNGDVRFVPRRYVMGSVGIAGALNETSRSSMPPELAVDERLSTARDIYEEMLADPALDSALREELNLRLVTARFAHKRHVDALLGELETRSAFSSPATLGSAPPLMLRRNLRESRDLLEADAAALESADPADPLALAAAYVRVADLLIAYGSARESESWYAKAWGSLLQGGMDASAASAWLHPRALLPVPDFATHPHSRALFGLTMDDTLPYRGYIDVSLTLTRNGDVRRAEIIEASADTPQRVRRRLLEYLRNQKMRPQLDAGVPVQREGIRVRFHYTY